MSIGTKFIYVSSRERVEEGSERKRGIDREGKAIYRAHTIYAIA